MSKKWFLIGPVRDGTEAKLKEQGYELTSQFHDASGVLLLAHWEKDSSARGRAARAVAYGLELKTVCTLEDDKTRKVMDTLVMAGDVRGITDAIRAQEAV